MGTVSAAAARYRGNRLCIVLRIGQIADHEREFSLVARHFGIGAEAGVDDAGGRKRLDFHGAVGAFGAEDDLALCTCGTQNYALSKKIRATLAATGLKWG